MPASDPDPAAAPNRSRWMRQGQAHTQVVVAAAELSHNAAGRAFTLAQLVQNLGRELWQPIQTAVIKARLPLHTFVAEHEPRYVEQAFALVLQHPADLVHLSKPRLPAVDAAGGGSGSVV